MFEEKYKLSVEKAYNKFKQSKGKELTRLEKLNFMKEVVGMHLGENIVQT